MKYRALSGMSVFWDGFFSSSVLGVFACLVGIFSLKLFWFVIALVVFSLNWLFHIAFHRNAYHFFEIYESGIRNHWIELRWEDIDAYSIKEVYITNFRNLLKKNNKPSFVCFGKSRDGDFRSQSPYECVFFEMTSKNLNMLAQLYDGKSSAIEEFLKRYHRT